MLAKKGLLIAFASAGFGTASNIVASSGNSINQMGWRSGSGMGMI